MPLSKEANRERKRSQRRSKHYEALAASLNEQWNISVHDQTVVHVYIAVPPAVGDECWMVARLRTHYQHITPKPDLTTDDNQPILGAIVQYRTSRLFDLVDFSRVKRSSHYPCRATHGGHAGANWYAAAELTGAINQQIFIRWDLGGHEEWLPSAQVTKLQKRTHKARCAAFTKFYGVLRDNPEWAKLRQNINFHDVTKEEKEAARKNNQSPA